MPSIFITNNGQHYLLTVAGDILLQVCSSFIWFKLWSGLPLLWYSPDFYSAAKKSRRNHRADSSPVTSEPQPVSTRILYPVVLLQLLYLQGGSTQAWEEKLAVCTCHWCSLFPCKTLQHFLVPTSLHFTRYIYNISPLFIKRKLA